MKCITYHPSVAYQGQVNLSYNRALFPVVSFPSNFHRILGPLNQLLKPYRLFLHEHLLHLRLVAHHGVCVQGPSEESCLQPGGQPPHSIYESFLGQNLHLFSHWL